MTENTKKNVLILEGLMKKIDHKTVVKPLSFRVKEGDIFGFLGPNGSGKTTTLRMITGLVFPTKGKIFIQGKEISRKEFNVGLQVGSIIENPAFYLQLTARENLQLTAELSAKKVNSKRIREVLELVRLSDNQNEKVKNFSLGMKQRLGFANALLCKPKLILLDEPTNGVDPLGLYEMKALVKELAAKEKITFLISSHMLREMEDLCNKVAIIENGELLVSGEVSQLLSEYQKTNLEDLFFACVKGVKA